MNEESSQEPELSLAFPFVVCKSSGGPFDDDAFVGGYQCGQIDSELKLAKDLAASYLFRTVYTAILPQMDVIAMYHGYTIESSPLEDSPEWSLVVFAVSSDVEDELMLDEDEDEEE